LDYWRISAIPLLALAVATSGRQAARFTDSVGEESQADKEAEPKQNELKR
jgi:hypothetical protein